MLHEYVPQKENNGSCVVFNRIMQSLHKFCVLPASLGAQQLREALVSTSNDTISSLCNADIMKLSYEPVSGQFPPNPSHMRAITAALSKRVALIQGAPGTGKTLVSGSIAKSAAAGLNTNHMRVVFAGADSNSALDNLQDSILNAGVQSLLRCGKKDRIRKDLRS